MHIDYSALIFNVLLHLISNDKQDNCKLILAKWKKKSGYGPWWKYLKYFFKNKRMQKKSQPLTRTTTGNSWIFTKNYFCLFICK